MQKDITLNDGNKIPMLGLGTWKSSPNEVGEAVRYALTKADYKHVDCAAIYGNEKEIGEVFSEVMDKEINRKDIFITSKLWNTEHKAENVEKACRQTLADLQLDYLDLYLVHWGVAFASGQGVYPKDQDGTMLTESVSLQETWTAMEGLVKKGLVKSIGVSNFLPPMLLDLLTYAQNPPVVNQIELHPYLSQEQFVAFCQSKNIQVTAYAPLGRAGQVMQSGKSLNVLTEPVIEVIAKRHKKSPAQVLLNWAIGRGTIVIPKSVTHERIKENTEIFDFELSEQEKGDIAALNKHLRLVNPGANWGIPYFS